jgi:hypothetical protein
MISFPRVSNQVRLITYNRDFYIAKKPERRKDAPNVYSVVLMLNLLMVAVPLGGFVPGLRVCCFPLAVHFLRGQLPPVGQH